MPALVLTHHDNSAVRYVYATDVIKTRSGKEYRTSLFTKAREYHEFSSNLDDVDARVLRGQLLQGVTNGTAFTLAMQGEALAVQSYSGSVLTVAATGLSDWMTNSAPVVFVAANGYQLVTTVASFTGTTITLAATPTAGLSRALVMPMQAVQLDDAQQFGKYAVNLQQLDVKAESVGPVALAGVGATLTTHASLPVFDRPVDAGSIVAESLIAMTERVDFGVVQATMTPRTVSDWARTISYVFNRDSERQWIKKLFATCRGRWRPFLLPTETPDLVIHTQPSSSAIRVYAPPTVGATDYVNQWFQSLAHRYLKFTTTLGIVLYRTVSAAVDNADGTATLTVDSMVSFAIHGNVTRISFMELVRFDDDEMRITYTDNGGSVQLQARVVQQ